MVLTNLTGRSGGLLRDEDDPFATGGAVMGGGDVDLGKDIDAFREPGGGN